MKGSPLLVACRFDDGGISGYTTVRGIMNARNIKGSFAIIADAIGTTFGGYDHMDATEMQTMKAEGHTFNNHTKSHQQTVLPTASQAACYAEINDGRTALVSNGLGDGVSEDIFIPPYGEWGTNYQLAIAQANVKMTVGTIGTGGQTSYGTSNAILDPTFLVPTAYIVRTTTTAYVDLILNTAINKNTSRNGAFLILTYHHVIGSPAAVDIERSTANFTTDMDNLAAKIAAGNAESVSLAELYLRCRP